MSAVICADAVFSDTVTTHSAVLPISFEIAFIVAVPVLTAVTLPFSTVATAAFDVSHFREVSSAPLP